jgi:hypothetical protein
MAKGRRKQRGGEMTGRPMSGGEGMPVRPMSGGEGMPVRPMSGGEGMPVRPMSGGHAPPPLTPGAYNPEGAPLAQSNYYTISGGRRRSRRKHKRSRKSKRGGDGGVIATAALPFGLLALQRYFKGSKTSKRGVAKMGRSFKRTFRRRRL